MLFLLAKLTELNFNMDAQTYSQIHVAIKPTNHLAYYQYERNVSNLLGIAVCGHAVSKVHTTMLSNLHSTKLTDVHCCKNAPFAPTMRGCLHAMSWMFESLLDV